MYIYVWFIYIHIHTQRERKKRRQKIKKAQQKPQVLITVPLETIGKVQHPSNSFLQTGNLPLAKKVIYKLGEGREARASFAGKNADSISKNTIP